MIHTFKCYIPLCWLRGDPLDLPISVSFFKQNLCFYFIIELFIQANMIDPTEAFFEVILETLLTLGFVALILLFNKTIHLYIPIITAVLFCENIVALLGLPVIIWLTVSDSWLSYVLIAYLILWDYVLICYIVKKVLVVNIIASMVVSFSYFALTYAGAYGIILLIF